MLSHPVKRTGFAGYEQTQTPGHDLELAEAGPGTVCGEFPRR